MPVYNNFLWKRLNFFGTCVLAAVGKNDICKINLGTFFCICQNFSVILRAKCK